MPRFSLAIIVLIGFTPVVIARAPAQPTVFPNILRIATGDQRW